MWGWLWLLGPLDLNLNWTSRQKARLYVYSIISNGQRPVELRMENPLDYSS